VTGISALNTGLLKVLRRHLGPLDEQAQKQIVLQSLLVAKVNRGVKRLRYLADAEFRAFSQWGEDGIIDWLIERLPQTPPTFVEFGVEDYRESNTRLLLFLRNWRGLVLDGSSENIADITRQEIYWRFDLTAKCAFINKENINGLMSTVGFGGEIGLLSIDIDGNDYWVWEAIDAIEPVIVVCEYNAVFGDVNQLSVPYNPDFQRTVAHSSNLYFGASLPALIRLGKQKGYEFVGTNSSGCNAFFIRKHLADQIIGSMDEVRAFPSAARESRNHRGQLTFVRGLGRAEIIADLPVCDFATGRVRSIAEMGRLYSSDWLKAQQ
jgi:hypothetical protein